MFVTLAIFVFVLGLLIFVHELGHFLAARARGVRVEEFGFGFPPRMAGIRRGDTTYSINWIPLGGFVKIFGEKGEGEGQRASFASRGVVERLWIVSAGVFMNLVLAFVLLSVGYFFGLPSPLTGEEQGVVRDVHIRIVSVLPKTPAERQGVAFGDIIERVDDRVFTTIPQLQGYLQERVGEPIALSLRRGEEILSLEITPEILPETGAGGIGVGLASIGRVSYPLHLAILKGAESTILITGQIIKAFFEIIKNLVTTGKIAVELTGPVGVAVMTGYAAKMGALYLLQFVALLSINLAVINFLPIPALDGGRAAFLLLEGIRRRGIREKTENIIHNIGFILLLVLVALVTYRDILRWGDKIVDVLKRSVGL